MASSYLFIGIFLILVFVVGRRVFSARKGSRYSEQSIFMRPIIYIVLTALLVVAGVQVLEILAIAISVILGVFLGLKLGSRSDIFEKDGKIMYKRSNEVLLIWIVAFVIRLCIDFLTNPYLMGVLTGTVTLASLSTAMLLSTANQANPIIIAADLLLGFSAGLLFGEALILRRDYNSRYGEKNQTDKKT